MAQSILKNLKDHLGYVPRSFLSQFVEPFVEIFGGSYPEVKRLSSSLPVICDEVQNYANK